MINKKLREKDLNSGFRRLISIILPMTEVIFYDFDVDKSAEENWGPIFDKNKHLLPKILPQLHNLLEQYGTITTLIKPAYSLISANNIMFYDEICYIAKRIELDPYCVLLLQLIYESSSACTTAIFQIDNKPFFFRTMDWPMEFLKDMTIGLNIIRNGKIIGKVTTWFGYVGFLTATNTVDDYTIAINYRRTEQISLSAMCKNFYRIITSKWPIGYLVRGIITSCKNQKNALDILKHAELISPCYITFFAKNGSSCIITRNCDSVENVRLNNLFQTNCDLGKSEPNILHSLERYKILQKITPDKDLLSQLLKYPIINDETIYYNYQFGNLYRSIIR